MGRRERGSIGPSAETKKDLPKKKEGPLHGHAAKIEQREHRKPAKMAADRERGVPDHKAAQKHQADSKSHAAARQASDASPSSSPGDRTAKLKAARDRQRQQDLAKARKLSRDIKQGKY